MQLKGKGLETTAALDVINVFVRERDVWFPPPLVLLLYHQRWRKQIVLCDSTASSILSMFCQTHSVGQNIGLYFSASLSVKCVPSLWKRQWTISSRNESEERLLPNDSLCLTTFLSRFRQSFRSNCFNCLCAFDFSSKLFVVYYTYLRLSFSSQYFSVCLLRQSHCMTGQLNSPCSCPVLNNPYFPVKSHLSHFKQDILTSERIHTFLFWWWKSMLKQKCC